MEVEMIINIPPAIPMQIAENRKNALDASQYLTKTANQKYTVLPSQTKFA